MEAIKHLKKDPILRKIIQQVGEIKYAPDKNYLKSLAVSIVNQQLSGKAANTIWNRLMELFPNNEFDPHVCIDISPDVLRNAGLSFSKISYLKDLSEKHVNNTISLSSLDYMSDEEVILHLRQVKGIGKWTAEMLLMFSMHRPDVLPMDDVGIQNALLKFYKIPREDKKQILETSEVWRPYRTMASWYLWKGLDDKISP